MASRSAPSRLRWVRLPPSRQDDVLDVVADVVVGVSDQRPSRAADARDAGDRRAAWRSASARPGHADGEHPAVVEVGGQLVDRARRDEAAPDEDADAVADLLDLVQQVRRQQDRHALVGAQPLDEQQQLAHALGVDVHRRLVEDEDRRVLDQRVGEAEPLAHAPRVAADLAVGVGGEPDVVEQGVDPRRGRVAPGGG